MEIVRREVEYSDPSAAHERAMKEKMQGAVEVKVEPQPNGRFKVSWGERTELRTRGSDIRKFQEAYERSVERRASPLDPISRMGLRRGGRELEQEQSLFRASTAYLNLQRAWREFQRASVGMDSALIQALDASMIESEEARVLQAVYSKLVQAGIGNIREAQGLLSQVGIQ